MPDNSVYDVDTLTGAVEDAPEAGRVPVNFGRLTLLAEVVTWSGEKGNRKKAVRPLAKGDKLKPGETLELVFQVDVQELNPALGFQYERRVVVRKSSPREKTDWSEVVEPALVQVFTDKWPQAAAKHPYICIEDEANIAGNVSQKSGKVFGVPKITAKYRNLEECVKARDARFGGVSQNGEAASGEIPENVLANAKILADSIKDDEQLRKMFGMSPYTDYDVDVLLSKVGRAAVEA